MKLFSLPDGVVDRFDRAQWITQPFDLTFGMMIGSSAPGNRTIRSTRFRLYQATAAPVWHPDLVTEETTIDRYETNWRTPTWKRHQPIHTPGSFIDDSVIPPDTTPSDLRPWHSAFSDPVRPKFRAYYYQWTALDLEPNQQAEETTIDRYYSPFEQPFFPVSRRYRVQLFQYEALTHEATLVGETIYVPSFDVPLGTPVRPPKRNGLHPIGAFQINEFGETVFVASFEPSWSQPIFLPRPLIQYMDGMVITPSLFPMTLTVFKKPMLSAGFMHF